MSGVSSDEARARSDGKRVANVIVISIAVAFIGDSAAQIVPAVFGLRAQPIAASPESPSERVCAEGIHSLALGLDHAEPEAWREGFLPGWEDAANVQQACAKSRPGLDAWAALLRLRQAEEDVVFRGLAELAPLRREVMARLPADLRWDQEPAQ